MPALIHGQVGTAAVETAQGIASFDRRTACEQGIGECGTAIVCQRAEQGIGRAVVERGSGIDSIGIAGGVLRAGE